MNYLVKENFKNSGSSYKKGELWSSVGASSESISYLVSRGLIESQAVCDESPTEIEEKDESASPQDSNLTSGKGDDLGGYEDDGSFVTKPKKGKKKKG